MDTDTLISYRLL